MMNALSFDVEDWYQIVYKQMVGEDIPPSRIVNVNVLRILDILAEYRVKATFFIVGAVAETYPKLVKAIHDQGHEIGSHSYAHQSLFQHTPVSFQTDLQKSLSVLEAITGEKPLGFRAPAFSITGQTLWAFNILKEEGIEYDSSIFPIKHRRYGIPMAQRLPYLIETSSGNGIKEFPLSTYCLLRKRLPFCGGGYMRLLPCFVVESVIQKLNVAGSPAIIYFHPYEFSKEESSIETGNLKMNLKFHLYKAAQNWGRTQSERKLRALLTSFEFGTVKAVLNCHNW